MKGVIIAAGYGTRFLPCSKTVPKEMFPLIDTPAIDFIVEEFISSGIKEILIVTSRRKKVLEDYFDREVELEGIFQKENNVSKLKSIKASDADIFFVRQKDMLGTGHALLTCKGFLGNEPFVVAYPDDIVFSKKPLASQLIDIYNEKKVSVLAGEIIDGDVSRYGVIDYKEENGYNKVYGIVEKPEPGKAPSKMISVGRYLFTGELLDLLSEQFKSHTKGEFYHIGAINDLAKAGKVFCSKFEGERLDIGDKLGYLEGIIKYSLEREDLKEQTIQILKKYIK